MRIRCVVLLALAAAAGCSGPLARPRFPQVEQVRESIHGGGERYRIHTECAGKARTSDDLLRCMSASGWQFVSRGLVYPEPECWEARDRGTADEMGPHCFVRAAGPLSERRGAD